MARGSAPAELSDFEKQRLANIAERDALLKKLAQEAEQAGLYQKLASRPSANGAAQKKKRTAVKRVKKEEDLQPRRTSSRLRGIVADSEVAKRKADEEYEATREAERAKRQRVSGDLGFGDIVVTGSLGRGSLLGTDILLKSAPNQYERTFGDEEIRATTDKELKALRERMSGLQLWERWEPNRIKITPERVYCMAFHPTPVKPLVFAGDKMGNLGIVDASQGGGLEVKREEEDAKEEKRRSGKGMNLGNTDPEESDEEEEDPDPVITTIKPHTRTISAVHAHPAQPERLYTASYDSSIRAVDLEKQITTELYGPSILDTDEPISGVDMPATDPRVIYFTTMTGALGRHDLRQEPVCTEFYQLSEKKIGGFSLHPAAPHYVATASLDRFLRLWDLRKVTKKLPFLVGEHESRLSVSHAEFNSVGQVATTSYDDTVKIHSFGVGGLSGSKKGGPTESPEAMTSWKPGYEVPAAAVKPEVVLKASLQCGRWVTM